MKINLLFICCISFFSQVLSMNIGDDGRFPLNRETSPVRRYLLPLDIRTQPALAQHMQRAIEEKIDDKRQRCLRTSN